jgi:L-malate glycosyltransferase
MKQSRILLLADTASPHTEKWALALAEKGYSIGLFSLNKSADRWFEEHKNIQILYEPSREKNLNFLLNKLSYVFLLPKLISVIKSYHPQLLHAHYASSYGLLGALSKFKPFALSCWGSDVYDFPNKSIIHKYILKFNLKAASQLLSTSQAMKNELEKYTKKEIVVIPFGVDCELFYSNNTLVKEKDMVYLGTIKSIEDQYGISTILEAVKILKEDFKYRDFKLLLVGGGSQQNKYRNMVNTLELNEHVIFTGKIPHSEIVHYHNMLDVFMNVSIVNESFGVSVIEAMACEKPVIVTRVPGLSEIVNNPELGIVVEKENPSQLVRALKKLIFYPELREIMGKKGREHVLANYDFKDCLQQMIDVYTQMLSTKSEIISKSIKQTEVVLAERI